MMETDWTGTMESSDGYTTYTITMPPLPLSAQLESMRKQRDEALRDCKRADTVGCVLLVLLALAVIF